MSSDLRRVVRVDENRNGRNIKVGVEGERLHDCVAHATFGIWQFHHERRIKSGLEEADRDGFGKIRLTRSLSHLSGLCSGTFDWRQRGSAGECVTEIDSQG